MKRWVILFSFALCSGCASVQTQAQQQEPPKLQQIVIDDLDAAIQIAKEDNDQVALQCWTVVKTALPAINRSAPPIKGIASAIQAKREIKARVTGGLPAEVIAGCANLYMQERVGVMNDFMSFLGLIK